MQKARKDGRVWNFVALGKHYRCFEGLSERGRLRPQRLRYVRHLDFRGAGQPRMNIVFTTHFGPLHPERKGDRNRRTPSSEVDSSSCGRWVDLAIRVNRDSRNLCWESLSHFEGRKESFRSRRWKEGVAPAHNQGCQVAKIDPFLPLDCARVKGVGAQSKGKEGINFCSVA